MKKISRSVSWFVLVFLASMLLLTLMLSGCSMKEYCADRYPPQITTKTKTDTVFAPRLIHVPFPGDTIYVTDTVLVTEGIAHMPLKTINTELCRAEAWIQYNTHEMELIQKDTVLEKIVDNAIMEATTTITETEVKEDEKDLSWWQTLFIWVGKAALAAVALLIVVAGIRKNLPI